MEKRMKTTPSPISSIQFYWGSLEKHPKSTIYKTSPKPLDSEKYTKFAIEIMRPNFQESLRPSSFTPGRT